LRLRVVRILSVIYLLGETYGWMPAQMDDFLPGGSGLCVHPECRILTVSVV
jgi:hypothetical protein